MKDNVFRFAFVAILGAVFALVSSAFVVTDNPPGVIQTAEIQETGIFFNRQPRTQPVDPTANVVPTPAPSFEAPPISVSPVVAVESPPKGLTPEQKDQLKGIIAQLIPLLIGAFLGSGSASPFIKLILEKLLGAVSGSTPPVQASVRKRVRKKKAPST